MKERKLAAKKHKTAQKKNGKNLRLSALICGFIFLFSAFLFLNGDQLAPLLTRGFLPFTQKVSAEEPQNEIENALFTRQEFFGASAIVPLPTFEARKKLGKLLESQPDNPNILEKLADASEKLSRFDEAENFLIRLAEIDSAKNENLAAFYHRRGQFEKEAGALRKILFTTETEKRHAVFEKLIDLARIHDLKNYLDADFYVEVARENADVYTIFEKLIDNLTEEKNYAEALNFARQAKTLFPESGGVLLEKEINILLEMNKSREAEAVYRAAFDPFWSETEAQKFYDFLNRQDRLRAYGAEIRAAFKKNPADFDAGVRLALYQNHDYEYGNDEIAPVFLRLEASKKNWTTGELAAAARLLLRAGETDLAARFLYTLYAREDFQRNTGFRAAVLYQLFEMFSDAENRKLPITKGDLRFYEDVAKADTNPGIATGILSLVFSDTNPREKLENQEAQATKYFNRAAAYRVFEEYKNEFPGAPELFQMYLDVVRLYAATKNTEIAENVLNEFAQKYESSNDYADAAMKLADAFAATGNDEKARETYRKILDYLGKNKKTDLRRKAKNRFGFSNDSTAEISRFAPIRNEGINIPNSNEKPKNDYYGDESKAVFRDYLARKTVEITYEEVLEKLVASFAKEKKTAEILAVYSDEIAKYPNEEWLYEQRLSWLEQTNLTAEQFEAYKTALARFQTNNWRDKLARFFLRQNRRSEFAAFSQDLIGKLNDREAQNYLSQFVDANVSRIDFDKQLYLKLYSAAHRRFPRNISFVGGLLRFYKAEKQEKEWRALSAEYYFESKEIREQFLDRLAETGELRAFLAKANGENIVYELFRADASVRLSDYESAVAAYRKLNQLYPNAPEFSRRLISFTRSFGQKNRELLTEAATTAESRADFTASSTEYRTESGEIYAELGNYEKARAEWEKLIATGAGRRETYLDAATVYWDYFQYADALRTIKNLREKFSDETLYAFETGAIFEARHETKQAIGEYVKALDANNDTDAQKEKSKKRLAFLAAKESEKDERKQSENEIEKTIDAAFLSERAKRKDASFLVLGYAEFLTKIKQNDKDEAILNQAIRQSGNTEFLEAAKIFYQTEENEAGEQTVLKRLSETATSPRRKIGYRLQLAESFEENHDRDAARAVLNRLVAKFPLNYGVLTEASDFYQRLGYENESAAVLQNALPASKGAYRTALAGKLAGRLINLDRLDSAAQILSELHDEDKANTEIFGELARVFVRRNDAANLRKTFLETVTALKQTATERRELDWQIARLRIEMIDAFTRLKDYKSGIEQHIEIINREPENEELTENAIRYVRRYGGAETLLDYYRKTAAEAFKNYRWNVVLARIYEANNDFDNAVKNYQTAIVNQPEMPDLYLAIARLETQRNNFDEAVKNLDTVLELTNDAPEYVKQKIEILKKAGRTAEIVAEKAKLPAEEEKKIAVDRFAEAKNLANTEKEKARAVYREAFETLLENPVHGELKAADIFAYVQSVREEEPLDKINERLWHLREKLVEIADENDAAGAGAARKRLSMLDGALTESIGTIAKTVGTDDELAALHQDLQSRIAETLLASDKHKIIALVQDISRRAGFGNLEEKILLKRLDETSFASDKQTHLRNLINFYNERGAYYKTFDVLEKYGSDDLPLKAETARLVGNDEKEVEALRLIYWKNGKSSASNDENVSRYLEILYQRNRDELKSLTEKSSIYQLQLINFLLGKGERELVHSAIENSGFTNAWKVSRNAETSLALKEFDENAECYFCDALQFDTIGEMIIQTPDKKSFLINDDWFRLTREYGEWLGEKITLQKMKSRTNANERRYFAEADKYLTAMTENQPRNAGEQIKLGAFYLEKNNVEAAIRHYRLALEIRPDDKPARAILGAAYEKIGRFDDAEQSYAKVLEEKTIESGLIYFQSWQKYGLSRKAREKLLPIITGFLQNSDAEDSVEFQNLIRAIAVSFENEQVKATENETEKETEKTDYFLRILAKRPTDVSLAAMLLNENLIGEREQPKFYELLINRSEDFSNYDYNYASVRRRTWTSSDAESVYDQENNYEIEEPENKRYEWRKKYLELLLKQRENSKAARLIAEIEKSLYKRYARPAHLRLARLRLQIRAGKFDAREIERFVGITVSDSATEIKTSGVERFNDVLRLFNKEKNEEKNEKKRESDARDISESFFARNLALGQFDAANFLGLTRALFQKNEAEKALLVLRLTIDAGDETKKENAFGEIAALDVVKARNPDAAKNAGIETNTILSQTETLRFAAEISYEFGQTEAAIAFRRRLLETNPADSNNKIKLAEILFAKAEKNEAANLLTEIIGDRNSLRSIRWQARMFLLRETGANAEMQDANFDAFSQFYQGTFAAGNGQTGAAAEFFINSLIADKDAEVSASQELIKSYALSGKFYAALKIAENDKDAKSDELLQTLAVAAEKIGDFQKAIEFEKAKSNGGSAERIANLQNAENEKNHRITDFTVNSENTRKL